MALSDQMLREGDVVLEMQLSLPRDARYVSLMRNVVGGVLQDSGAPEDAVDDIQMVLSEACANAVRHGIGSPGYTVALSLGPRGCAIEVSDLGPGFELPIDWDDLDGLDPDTERGRGLLLIRALVDDLEFLPREVGAHLRLVKHFEAFTVDRPRQDGWPTGAGDIAGTSALRWHGNVDALGEST